jgi:hypothetical protein
MNKRETIRIGFRPSCRITVVQKWLPVQQSAWLSRGLTVSTLKLFDASDF